MKKRSSFFDILFSIRFDKRFWKSFGLEVGLTFSMGILLLLYLSAASNAFYPLSHLYDPDIMNNPMQLVNFQGDFELIVSKLVFFTLIMFFGELYTFSFFKFKQLSLFLTEKQIKGKFKSFFAINFISWIIYLGYLAFVIVLMIASYFSIPKDAIFIYINLFFFLAGIAGLVVLMFFKTFFVLSWYIKHEKDLKSSIFSFKYYMKALLYTFTVTVIFFLLFGLLSLTIGPAAVYLMSFVYILVITFTQILFLELVENG